MAKDRNGLTFGKGLLTVLDGGTGIGLSSYDAAHKINEDTPYEEQIQEINSIGNGEYSNFDALSQDYTRLNSYGPVNYNTVRGTDGSDDAQNIFGSAFGGAGAGATTGSSIAPGMGTLIGLGVGTMLGTFGSALGTADRDRWARDEQQRLQAEMDNARIRANQRLRTQHENLLSDNFSNGVMRVAKRGGEIQRKPMTITEFADRVMKRQKASDKTHSAGIQRIRKDGGVCIRIKR